MGGYGRILRSSFVSLNFNDKDLNICLPIEDKNLEIIQQSFKDSSSKNLSELTNNDKIFI